MLSTHANFNARSVSNFYSFWVHPPIGVKISVNCQNALLPLFEGKKGKENKPAIAECKLVPLLLK